jgi:acyl-CoA thioesterase
VASTTFLQTFRVVVADDARFRVEAEIHDVWGIVFAHGGIVMAGMLHAADLVLSRGDMRLASATATFCRPVPCGKVDIDVDILRNGRNGVQIHASLRSAGDTDPTPNAVATLVYTTQAEGWPELHGPALPVGLDAPPGPTAPRFGTDADGGPGGNFFGQTDWRPAHDQPGDPLRKLVWFRFVGGPARRLDGSWVPALLAVPGDALGMAVVAEVSDVMGRLTAPSLQISMQFFAPAVGDWLGIDTGCFETRGAIASGVATLWNTDGTLVAAVSQTAMLRPI